MKIDSKNLFGYLVLIVTTMLGSLSLILFGFFLYGVSFTVAEFAPVSIDLLVWDALLCLLFFLQHSIMIRKSFRRALMTIVPQHYQGVLFALASAVALIILVFFWQHANQTLIDLQGGYSLAMQGVFFASLIGLVWSMSALHAFDMFGAQPVLARMGASRVRNMPFTIRGPYRWVRHPAYFFILLMIWFSPAITLDRLLFNLLFTGWIVLGTRLEERDLVAQFGKAYLDYQGKVPMLIPWKPHIPYLSGGSDDGIG